MCVCVTLCGVCVWSACELCVCVTDDDGSLCASVGMRNGGEELSRVTPVFGGWTGTKGGGCVCVCVWVCVSVCVCVHNVSESREVEHSGLGK